MKNLWIAMLCIGALCPLASAEETAIFGVKVLPTIQYAFEDTWTKTPSGRGPRLAIATRLVPDQPVHIQILASNYATDGDGMANVDYNISFFRPDGSLSSTKTGLVLVPKVKGVDNGFVTKASEIVILTVHPTDPQGVWRVVVEATDRVSQTIARDEAKLEVDEKYGTGALPENFYAGTWMATYHFNPQPQQMQAYLRYMAENPPMREGKAQPLEKQGPMLGFFEQVLTDNPWLLSHLIDGFAKATSAEQMQLAGLLAYAKRDDAQFAGILSVDIKKAVSRYRNTKWPVPTAEPLEGAQLDVLWGRFFASGAYQPIRELVGVLAYYPHRDALDNFSKLSKKPKIVPVEVLKSAVFRSAVWSIGSNIKQDTLVRDYCEGMLMRKELPDGVQVWLAGGLRASQETKGN